MYAATATSGVRIENELQIRQPPEVKSTDDLKCRIAESEKENNYHQIFI
jgi:hypothetical protein